MKAGVRRESIMERLEQGQTVYISDLANELNVSAMTVRRDLSRFSEQGLVTLIHGGAVLNRGAAVSYSRRVRKQKFQKEKRRIAEYCSKLVTEGSSVFLSCGSTPEQIAEVLFFRKNITVFTHSLPVINILAAAKDLQLITTPGVFMEKPQGFFGEMTLEFIRNYRIDVLFFGGDGIDIGHGATDSHLDDAGMKRLLVKQAEKVVYVVDHTKIGAISFVTVADLDEIDLVVTDKDADLAVVEDLRRCAGVEIALV